MRNPNVYIGKIQPNLNWSRAICGRTLVDRGYIFKLTIFIKTRLKFAKDPNKSIDALPRL